MEVCRRSSWLLPLLGVILLAVALQGVQGEVEIEGPSESECRPYIEKALRSLEHGAGDADVGQSSEEASSKNNLETDEKQSDEQRSKEVSDNETDTKESEEKGAETQDAENKAEESQSKTDDSIESTEQEETENIGSSETEEAKSTEEIPEVASVGDDKLLKEETEDGSPDEATTESSSTETAEEVETAEDLETIEYVETTENIETTEDIQSADSSPEHIVQEVSAETPVPEDISSEQAEDKQESSSETVEEIQKPSNEESKEEIPLSQDSALTPDEPDESSSNERQSTASDNKESEETQSDVPLSTSENQEDADTGDETESTEKDADENLVVSSEIDNTQQNASSEEQENEAESQQHSIDKRSIEESTENGSAENAQSEDNEKVDENDDTAESHESIEKKSAEDSIEEKNKAEDQVERAEAKETSDDETSEKKETPVSEESDSQESNAKEESIEEDKEKGNKESGDKHFSNEDSQNEESIENVASDTAPEEDLILEVDIPTNLRPRDHVDQLLKLDREATKTEEIIDRISDITLRELKRLYENAIKPLETLYKYRDLSNRHYGDAEIFSKPLILFMGPWSGGKSSIINYLLDVEYNDTALRTGAEPSPAYFNLLMYGEEEEVLDGTQLAADYTFSGLQKFGQGLEERLRGVKLKSKLLEKVNIVEIPGILEVRKQVSRVFPFNDACQWFIDRADIIFLVYDPSKLDVGPETEAILDQLKGREYQTRIILNKADQVKPEELMRVQGALIWNISPLMSSPQPPIMYTTSLWSRPYEQWAPVRLLQAQERAFLRDLRSAVDRRIENKIASARRFAVRVRNHAKMVDCYLTTYYNHKSIFGNRKQVSDAIIEHPQDYHIYEGLSTLTNISRYDLPDPDVYKDFFRLNPLYEFQQLSATCTYFRGCPINKLDVAIAYDLPELVGKHKRLVEAALLESNQDQTQGS